MEPKFCRKCGAELKKKSKKIGEGFDPFTGEKAEKSVPMRVCPNLDAEPGHDRWEKNPDNATDEWEPWEG